MFSLLVSRNHSLNSVFALRTPHTAQYSFLVLINFLKRYNDAEASIRRLYLQTALLLLSCSKNFIDSKFTKQICLTVCHLCQHDPQIELRQFSLSIIEKIFEHKPANVFHEETFDVLTRVCFDQIASFRQFAQTKLVNIYTELMSHYPPELFYLSPVGKIVGALRVAFHETKDKPGRQHLYEQLMQINRFLQTNRDED